MFVFSRFFRYFLEVSRLGSIRKAAEHLNVSASAIDRQILSAEEELGVALFERLPTGLRPTAAGELLLKSAGDWKRDFERVRTQIGDLKGLRRGEVQIALIDALSKGLVPDTIRRTQADYPGISFSLSVLDNVAIAARLLEGAADFGIMLNPRTSRDLMVQAHLDVALGVVTAIDHSIARYEKIRFSQAAQYPIVAPAEPLALSEQYRVLLAASGANPVVLATSDNIQMIVSLVRDGSGVGFLSWIDAMEEVRKGELAFIPLSDPILKPLSLALCVVPNRQLSMAARLVLGKIEAAFAANAG